MKFRIRQPSPQGSDEPETDVWLELSADGRPILYATSRGRNDRYAILSVRLNGTLIRHDPVPSHLSFKLDAKDRILDSTLEK